jgi:hypothetical protein
MVSEASANKLGLAKEQLAKVQVAAWDPVDWMDLSLYAFYTLENAVVAAADQVGVSWKQTHPSKVDAATELHARYGLPDIADLLSDLNAIRKSSAYGESPRHHGRTAEDIADEVEEYVSEVESLLLQKEEEEEEESVEDDEEEADVDGGGE